MPDLLDICKSERGNIWLTTDEGEYHHCYIRLPDGPDRWLEISIRPCNYPGLLVQTVTITEAELTKHILKEFDGWIARKMCLESVPLEDGYIVAPSPPTMSEAEM